MTQTSDFLKRFQLSRVPDELIDTYKSWFERYPSYAKESLSQITWLDGAWFQLLIYELLVQLGCKVDVVDIDNTEMTPDFLVSRGGRNCYVEVTTVNPGDNPSVADRNLEDALCKLNSLISSDFQIRLIVEGKISRTLSKKELTNTFGKLVSEHDPVMVREQIDLMGEYGAPYTEIKDKGWVLRGELRPIPPEGKHRTSPGLIVDVGGSYTGDASRNVQKAVSAKAKKYGCLDAPLIVAVNVLDPRFDREAEMATLFGHEQIQYFPDLPEVADRLIRKAEGVWVKGGYKPRYTRLTGVMFFRSFFPWSPRGSASLYLNPSIDELELPKPCYRLPHAKGEDGRMRWVEGVDIETLLATS